MLETISEKNPALLIPLLSVLGAAVVFTVWILAHYWQKVRQQEAEASLKKDMLARDFSAADIERVLLATAGGTADASREKETITDNEYYLVEKMLDDERPVEEIERLVRAFKSGEKPAPKPAAEERVMA